MRTISEIIKDAGGAKAIADACGNKFKVDAVYKWPDIGIPDRHWPLIIERAESSPEELYTANLAARSPTPSETRESA
jgi:hypothetical protein